MQSNPTLEEQWKPVVGYEDVYEVSNKGRIKRVGRAAGTVSGYILKDSCDKEGYRLISLNKNNKGTMYKVHRLVAKAWIENSDPERNQVNHKDGIKDNNQVENLEWVTNSENHQHAWATGLEKPKYGEDSHLSKLKEFQVLEIRTSTESYNILAQKYCVSYETVRRAKLKESWAHL